MVSQVVHLSWKFPVEAHKQLQPDKNYSPLTWTRTRVLLTPSCHCLKLQYPRCWEHSLFFLLLTFSKCGCAHRCFHRGKQKIEKQSEETPELSLGAAGLRRRNRQQWGSLLFLLREMLHLPEPGHSVLAANLVPLTLEVIRCKHIQFMSCSEVSPPSSEASDVYDLSHWLLIYIDVTQPYSSNV